MDSRRFNHCWLNRNKINTVIEFLICRGGLRSVLTPRDMLPVMSMTTMATSQEKFNTLILFQSMTSNRINFQSLMKKIAQG